MCPTFLTLKTSQLQLPAFMISPRQRLGCFPNTRAAPEPQASGEQTLQWDSNPHQALHQRLCWDLAPPVSPAWLGPSHKLGTSICSRPFSDPDLSFSVEKPAWEGHVVTQDLKVWKVSGDGACCALDPNWATPWCWPCDSGSCPCLPFHRHQQPNLPPPWVLHRGLRAWD